MLFTTQDTWLKFGAALELFVVNKAAAIADCLLMHFDIF